MKAARSVAGDRRYIKDLRFQQIRALVETARAGSFAAAARRLGLSTPSVWRQVRALEDDYGVPLVTVHGRDVRPTPDGMLLLDVASPLVDGFDALKHVFADRSRSAARELRIATPGTIVSSILHDAIAGYCRSHPTGLSNRVTVAMSARHHDVIHSYVSMGIGIALTTRPIFEAMPR